MISAGEVRQVGFKMSCPSSWIGTNESPVQTTAPTQADIAAFKAKYCQKNATVKVDPVFSSSGSSSSLSLLNDILSRARNPKYEQGGWQY